LNLDITVRLSGGTAPVAVAAPRQGRFPETGRGSFEDITLSCSDEFQIVLIGLFPRFTSVLCAFMR